ELDVSGAEIGERLRDLLEDLLLQRALAGELGDDPRAGTGYLPTRRADASSLDRQRYAVQFGHLAVLSRTHRGQCLKIGDEPRKRVDRVTTCGQVTSPHSSPSEALSPGFSSCEAWSG